MLEKLAEGKFHLTVGMTGAQRSGGCDLSDGNRCEDGRSHLASLGWKTKRDTWPVLLSRRMLQAYGFWYFEKILQGD